MKPHEAATTYRVLHRIRHFILAFTGMFVGHHRVYVNFTFLNNFVGFVGRGTKDFLSPTPGLTACTVTGLTAVHMCTVSGVATYEGCMHCIKMNK